VSKGTNERGTNERGDEVVLPGTVPDVRAFCFLAFL